MATHSSALQDDGQCKPQDVHKMVCMGRTQGDGMENVTAEKNEAKPTKSRLGDTLIYHPTNLRQTNSIPPVTPTGVIVNLVPKHVSSTKDDKHILNGLKFKEPKFVPYEPYKAAVNPIIPFDKRNRRLPKTDVNVNVSISQVAALKIQETNVTIAETSKEKIGISSESKWENEKKLYDIEIQRLKQENGQLENQLKFQAQVNGELKNLLVAAVGEDLETRVHLLTEDKLQLARALLNSAQHLSTHQEQTEWLAGQCEVWRSKFLASSLMVEELAKWKAALSQRTTDLEEAIKRLLQEHNHIRALSLQTYKTLNTLRQTFDPVGVSSPKKYELQNANIVGLAKSCEQLAHILKVQLLSGMCSSSSHVNTNIAGLEELTSAEKIAEQLLMSSKLLMSGRQEDACSAVMGAAVAVGGKMFFPGNESKMACCPHCSGEIKQL